ncbi:MAG: enoyl-CoA hydratase/isomerase family protein [Candidatus Hermodarchaeota archaeon]
MGNDVLYEQEGKIGKITLNRPDKNNSLELTTVKSLIEFFQISAQNEDICVILAANGKNFTVGDDLKYSYDLINDINKLPEAVEFIGSYQTLTRSMLAHPGIIIAGLHGWTIGGGFEMLLSCDLRIAATDTKIMLPELGVGLFFSNASTKLLSRIIGLGRAKKIMLLGEELNAEDAYNIGLVSEICKPESLDRILKKTANKILQKSHLGLQFGKKLLNENYDKNIEGVLDSEQLAIITAGQSDEFKKRIQKFLKH